MPNGTGAQLPASIPDYVRNEVAGNATLVDRYLRDASYRKELLENPAAVSQRDGLNFSEQTVQWIEERVKYHGLKHLTEGGYAVSPM